MFGRKNVPLNQMPNTNTETIRRLSDEDLHRFIADHRAGSERHIRGQVELRRRESWPARWALAISVVALVVSVFRP